MARSRRRSRRNARSLSLVPLIFIAGVALWLFNEAARYPILLVLLVAVTSGLAAWRISVRAKRARTFAEAQRVQALIYAERARAIQSYHVMNPREFEEAIAYLCRRDGCLDATVTGKAGDLGADVVATTPDGRRLVIQAKRYAAGHLVTGPALQTFGGTCYAVHRAELAAVVTTSAFTKQAREYAALMRIVLVDANTLAGWAAQNGPPPWLAALPVSSLL